MIHEIEHQVATAIKGILARLGRSYLGDRLALDAQATVRRYCQQPRAPHETRRFLGLQEQLDATVTGGLQLQDTEQELVKAVLAAVKCCLTLLQDGRWPDAGQQAAKSVYDAVQREQGKLFEQGDNSPKAVSAYLHGFGKLPAEDIRVMEQAEQTRKGQRAQHARQHGGRLPGGPPKRTGNPAVDKYLREKWLRER